MRLGKKGDLHPLPLLVLVKADSGVHGDPATPIPTDDDREHALKGHKNQHVITIRMTGVVTTVRMHLVRRYVSTHERACAVLVVNPPEMTDGHGFVAALRRAIASKRFIEQFGHIDWPKRFTPDDQWGAMILLGDRRMSRPRNCVLVDQNGTRHECVAEAFTQTYQVFILIYPVATLTRTSIVVP